MADVSRLLLRYHLVGRGTPIRVGLASVRCGHYIGQPPCSGLIKLPHWVVFNLIGGRLGDLLRS